VVTSARDPVLIGERAIDLAEAAGADEVEAVVSADEARLTRFANSEIHQNVAEVNTTVNLRFVDGKRVGVMSTNRLDDEALTILAYGTMVHVAEAAVRDALARERTQFVSATFNQLPCLGV